MRKRLFGTLVILLCLTVMAFGQNEPPKYMYCEIVGKAKFLSSKIDVEIDYGQQKRWLTDHRLADEDGKTVSFVNMIDALNYMGERGWKFVHAYETKDGETIIKHYVLERLYSEKEAPKTKSN